MSDESSETEYGAGRYTPTVVDSSLKGVPDDPVTVEMAPDRDLNWLQAIRENKLPKEPESEGGDLDARIEKVWDAVNGMDISNKSEHIQASD
jgi:hypothetical protein